MSERESVPVSEPGAAVRIKPRTVAEVRKLERRHGVMQDKGGLMHGGHMNCGCPTAREIQDHYALKCVKHRLAACVACCQRCDEWRRDAD